MKKYADKYHTLSVQYNKMMHFWENARSGGGVQNLSFYCLRHNLLLTSLAILIRLTSITKKIPL